MANPYETGLDLLKSRVIGNPYVSHEELTDEEIRRVNEVLLYWKYYRGDHWDVQRPKGEPQNTINYSARFVDKGVSFLMGKGFTINVRKEAEDITKPFIDEVLDDNNRLLLGLEMAQSGGVTGEAYVRVSLQHYDKDTEPFYAELYPNGRIRIQVLPTYACFPRWNNHDPDKMDEIRIIYPIRVQVRDGEYKTVWYEEHITPTRIREYIDGQLQSDRVNELGVIYVVRIRNLIVANHPYGKSDLQDIIPLNRELNEKTTDVSDIINYHASPVTLIYGAKANNLEKGARKVWGGLPKDARVENLELQSDLSASMNYIQLIRKSMFELASMPQDALGGEDLKSNITGVALNLKYQPLIDINNKKKLTYGEGIQEICRLILRYADVYELEGFKVDEFRKLKGLDKWHVDVEFPNPLPKDELLQVQLIVEKLNNHLMTRLDALKELGEYDAQAKLQEIMDEFIEWQNLMFEETTERSLEDEPDDTEEDINLGGIKRDRADLMGHTGRNHSKEDDG